MRFNSWLDAVRSRFSHSPRRAGQKLRRRRMPRAVEPLESRTLLSVTSVFDPIAGELDISSDAAADTIVVSVDEMTNEV
ncbi:MAG: hypothetical protein VX304_16705, partial [Planctomycetota bacterium]|nr:hypothetical protein [Planctomycetota bacterium]